MAVEETIPHESVGHGENTSHRTDETIFCELLVRLVLIIASDAFARLRVGGPQQPCSEEEEHPGEALHEGGTDHDEHQAQEQRHNDSREQRFLLEFARNLEGVQDDDEDEEVVEGQRPFGHPSGIELSTVGGAVDCPDSHAEHQGESNVAERPRGCFLQRGSMGLTNVAKNIEGNQTEHHTAQADPSEDMNVHRTPFTGNTTSNVRSLPTRFGVATPGTDPCRDDGIALVGSTPLVYQD